MKKLVFLGILLGSQVGAWAQFGANDPTFNPGDSGYNNGPQGAVSNVLVQPDGKLILCGNFIAYKGSINGYLVRVDANGNQDPTFNTGTGPASPLGGAVWTTALQPDGKVIIGGNFTTYNGSNRNRIARVNANGSLDNSFTVGNGANNQVRHVMVQPDGKIIAVGEFTSYNSTSRNRIVRINTDGSVDATFAPGTGANQSIRTCALQPDGKIVICGTFTTYNGTSRNGIARLNTDGSLDNTFSVGTGFNSWVWDLAVLANGKICVGGEFTTYNGIACNQIVRLNTNGSFDATFGSGSGPSDGAILDIDTLPGEKLLVSGSFLSYSGNPYNSVVRLNANGSVDNTFASGNRINGTVMATYIPATDKFMAWGGFNTYNNRAYNYLVRLHGNGVVDNTFNKGTGAGSNVFTVSLQADQKALIGGLFTSYNDTVRNYLARLNPNGSIDNSFNMGTGFNDYVWKTFIQADSKIVVGGNFTSYNGSPHNRILRLNTDGSTDNTFAVGTGANNWVTAIIQQPDGKLLLGGAFTTFNGVSANGLVRLNADGSTDNTFNMGTGANGEVRTISLQPDGKIIIGGTFTSWNGTNRNRIARINADGSLDTGFDPGTGADDVVLSSCVQPDGKIIVGGAFWYFNGTNRDFVVRLNADGSLDNGFNTGTGPNGDVWDIALRPDGKIFIAGRFLSFNGQDIACIARLHANGNRDLSFYPGAGTAFFFTGSINSMAVKPNGNVLIGGDFEEYNGVGRNNVARVLNCLPDAVTDTHTACNSYTWINGITYTQSNHTATHTLTNATGCDSIITLNLTIHQNPATIDLQTACESYTWIDGLTYTQNNNTATYTVSNGVSCDSIITLNLTINHNSTGTDTQTACESYTWIDGITYTQSNNTATYTLTGASGCDSIVTLNLTLQMPQTTVTQNGHQLTADASGATYLWIDCENHTPIAGATGQSYTAIADGSYAVAITSGVCSDTSDCYSINLLKIENPEIDTWQIYPNPSGGVIHLTGLLHSAQIMVLDIYGQALLIQQVKSPQAALDLSGFPSGIYFVRISSEYGDSIKKVIRN